MSLEKIALLPEGFHDVLAPDAMQGELLRNQLLRYFSRYGYELVAPPLLEFEESLFHGTGNAIAANSFRVMDPSSQSMMGIRSDITTQITRLVTTRLTSSPLPLRLSYAGTVLSVQGDNLQAKRQRTQVGVELIGAPFVSSEIEIIQVVLGALADLGTNHISVDFSLPKVKALFIESLGLSGEQQAILDIALNKKETEIISQYTGTATHIILELITPSSDYKSTLKLLADLALPEGANEQITQLGEVINTLRALQPSLTITIDPFESYGQYYHSGISFSLFSQTHDCQVGRGGRYMISSLEKEIEAVGFTFYNDTLLPLLPQEQPATRIYVPYGTDDSAIQSLQDQQFVTILGLDKVTDIKAEAKRLECQALWSGKKVEKM